MTDIKQAHLFDLKNLSDLPEEIRSQVLIKKSDKITNKLEQLLKEACKPLSIDQAMVGMWRKFGVNKERKYWVAKLYNESKRGSGHIQSVKGKRGVYKYV